jgi:hypothetical protein
MTNMSAKKRPPERLCPRGAKDTHFSGSDWTPLRHAGGKGGKPSSAATSAHGVSEASRLRPCKRPFASRPAGISPRDIPSAGSSTWRNRIRSPGLLPHQHSFAVRSTHEMRRIWDFFFRVKAGFLRPARDSLPRPESPSRSAFALDGTLAFRPRTLYAET